jgi:hypothetical protein
MAAKKSRANSSFYDKVHIMNETNNKPVSEKVLNQDSVSETLEVAESREEKVSSPSETYFASQVSFTEAVKMTGKNKGTISKDTKSGKLHYKVSDTGQKLYKVSDLYTLYGLQNPEETKFKPQKKLAETPKETESNTVEIAVLQERLRAQEVLLSVKDAQIRDLQTSRDRLLTQNERLTLLLPSADSSKETAATMQETSKPSFWKRFFG